MYHLRGEKLTVKEISSATDIQVICSTQKPGEVIDEETIDTFFSHPRYTRVKDPSAMQGVMQLSTFENQPVFAVTYSSPERMYNLLSFVVLYEQKYQWVNRKKISSPYWLFILYFISGLFYQLVCAPKLCYLYKRIVSLSNFLLPR